MSLKLEEQIRSLRHHDHVCMIYESPEEQMAAIVPFIQTGLERNELCLYVADDNSVREVIEALGAGGVDVERETRGGRLKLLTKREVYLKDGEFIPDVVVGFLDEWVKKSLAEGYTGLRLTGEMTWALGEETGCERLIEYENILNDYFPNHPVVAICQYNRNRFSPPVIRDVLRTHPVVVLGSQVCPNLYYEPPELILGKTGDSFRVDWMIRQLKKTRSSEQALEEANHMLETSNARKDEFLAMLGHELRNPLAAINNGIALLGLGTLDHEHTMQVQKTIERQMKNITHLVDDLLDVARVTRGKITLSRQPVEMNGVLRHVLDSMQNEVASQQHQVSLELMDAPVFVQGDETRLEQIVHNVLQNAVKYTPSGGRISVRLEEKDGKVVLRISDSGVGMSPDLLKNAFELFAQGERGLSRKEGGLGIGLTLARTLVELHGGGIQAESPGKNRGTTLIITLPKADSGAGSARAPVRERETPRMHVLLVEDNQAVAQTLAMLIEQLGQRVTVAPDGESALDQAKSLVPDLVLLDIGLPGIDGYEVCKHLRALYGPDIPIMALTGYGKSEDARSVRFTDYYKKPLSLTSLLDIINSVQHSRERKQRSREF